MFRLWAWKWEIVNFLESNFYQRILLWFWHFLWSILCTCAPNSLKWSPLKARKQHQETSKQANQSYHWNFKQITQLAHLLTFKNISKNKSSKNKFMQKSIEFLVITVDGYLSHTIHKFSIKKFINKTFASLGIHQQNEIWVSCHKFRLWKSSIKKIIFTTQQNWIQLILIIRERYFVLSNNQLQNKEFPVRKITWRSKKSSFLESAIIFLLLRIFLFKFRQHSTLSRIKNLSFYPIPFTIKFPSRIHLYEHKNYRFSCRKHFWGCTHKYFIKFIPVFDTFPGEYDNFIQTNEITCVHFIGTV